MFVFKSKLGYVRSGWHILFASLLLFIAQLVFTIPGFVLFERMRTNEDRSHLLTQISEYPWVELMINGGGVVGAIFVTVLVWRLVNKKRVIDLGMSINALHMKDFVAGLLLGGISMTAIFLVLLWTGAIHIDGKLLAPDLSIYSFTYLILFILVGFSEELFFRGYIMKTMLERNNSIWLAAIVSAVIFSIFHGSNPNVTLFGLINIGLVGLLFSYMYIVTRNLWMPIGYHITWNYFQGNVFGFPVSGTDPHGFYKISVESGNDVFTGGYFGPEGGILASLLIIIGFLITFRYCQGRVKP